MMIDYIKLKNYRQYKDVTIELGVGEQRKNVVIIEGANGAGKTNLLNAITWCLYGKEIHLSTKYPGLPIINTLILDKLGANNKTNVEVEIQLSSNDKSKRYKIKRTRIIQKLENGDIEEITDRYISNQPDGTKLELFVQIGKDIKGHYKEPANIIKRLLPEKINEYFFFDGERLDDYFKEESGDKIKEAVFKISQLELLDRMMYHLNNAKTGFLTSSKDLTPNIKELQEKKNLFQDALERTKVEVENLINDKKEAKKYRDELNKELVELSPGIIKRLADERNDLEQEISQLESEFNKKQKEKSDYLIDMALIVFNYKPISQVLQIIDKEEEAGDIPPEYKKNFLKKLLEKGICICGTDISKDNPQRKSIEILIQNCSDITNISDEIIKLGGELRSLYEQISKFDKKRITYTNEINELEERIRKKRERIKKIEEEIKNCDIEEIKRKEEKLERYNSEISKIDQRIGEKKIYIEQINEKIRIIDIDLKKELKKEEKLKELSRICSFCDKALEFANKIKNEIMEETRKEIEERTKQGFFNIIWKKETYKDVKIDSNYNFSVLDQSYREAIGTLSAGEREALALSFIGALNIVSGFDAPIVIDTPLARIDPEARENIAKTISQYFGDNQIILLVTGAEYTPTVRKILQKNIHKEYKIEFKEYKAGCEAQVVSYGR